MLAGAVAAAGSTQEFKWDELPMRGRISGATVLPPGPGATFHQLKIENNSPTPATVTVLTIDRPQVSGPRYQLTGQVRHEGVERIGYLELWNHFPNGQYFSRTLGEEGPLMKLQGTSPWRPFVLPFDATGAPPPTRLVLNVVLPGRGVVYLGPLELSDDHRPDLSRSDSRTTDRVGGMAGAIAGTAIGFLGALIGLFTSLGRARRFVIVSTMALIVFGTISLVAGIAALAQSAPYAVYYPLLLIGLLAAVVPLGVRPAIRRRYAEIELRTMRAHDLA